MTSDRRRQLHRLLGALLAAPLLLWTATGLLFLLKPGWRGAYELLQPFRPAASGLGPAIPVGEAASIAGIAALDRAELGDTALGVVWRLTDTAVVGPGGQSVPLAQIVQVRSLGNFVQIITRDGMKYLIKYQADPATTTAALRRAAGLGGPAH